MSLEFDDWVRLHESIDQALRDAGIEAQHMVTPDPRRSPRPPSRDPRRAHLTDLWIITILVVQPLGLFFQGFFQESGKDAYRKLKTLLVRAMLAPSEVAQAVGEVRIRAADGGPTLQLASELPEVAVAQLRDLDWSVYSEDAVLSWDRVRSRWEPG